MERLEKCRRCRERRRLAFFIVISLVSKTTVVYGRPDVNVALNRPTFMSSVYYAPTLGGYFVPSRAVDGNKDAVSLKVDNSCVHTLWETHPWWAVDLGTRLAVTAVLFTNRADGVGYRSNNFIVGLTDESPEVTAPTLWNYDVCGQWPGVVGDGATVYMKCKCDLPYRRYLIVQLPSTDVHLNFCEIEVYIEYWEWHHQIGQKMINKVANSFQVEHRLGCMIECSKSPICDSYNFRPSDKTCQLNTHDTPLIANSADVVADSAWGWWCTDFTVVV